MPFMLLLAGIVVLGPTAEVTTAASHAALKYAVFVSACQQQLPVEKPALLLLLLCCYFTCMSYHKVVLCFVLYGALQSAVAVAVLQRLHRCNSL
jgi:hypothetical protein